jgi:hypothetical protein
MAKVLSAVDTISCSFQGKVVTSPASKLQVLGAAVLVSTDVEGQTVSLCGGASSQQPVCASVSTLSAGKSSKLQCGGKSVLLDSLAGTTTPVHSPNTLSLLPVVQTKLEAT